MRHSLRAAAFTCLLLTVAAAARAELRVVGLDGRPVDPFKAAAGVRANAFVFTTTDCPISNRYAPEIRRLYESFRHRGIRFWLVYANPREQAAALGEHAARFSYTFDAIRDPHHDLVARLGA
jgi:hypothetical protein